MSSCWEFLYLKTGKLLTVGIFMELFSLLGGIAQGALGNRRHRHSATTVRWKVYQEVRESLYVVRNTHSVYRIL